MEYSNAQIEKLIKGIEDGSITELDLPLDYYQALTKYLEKAVLEGFGVGFDAIATDTFLQELVTNVYMFGAAKTYQQVKEISSLLTDENGKVRTSREFNDIARQTYDNWNDNWGRTEYNTAIAQADSASKWQRIEQEKDVLPILEYSAIGDACDICQPLDGMTALVDDPIWDSVAPTNHFNCKCIVLQHDESKPLTESPEDIVGPVVEQMQSKGQDIFINNVGKTGEIFTKGHPYFEVAKEDRALALANFGLPLPEFIPQPELFTKNGVILDQKFLSLLRKPITAVEGKNSYITIGKNEVTLNTGKRFKGSPYHREAVSYHEVGHLIHEQNDIINFGRIVSDEYTTHFKELKKLVKEPWSIDLKLNEILKLGFSDATILEKYGAKNRDDLLNIIGSAKDALMSLTNGNYGGGHTKSYMKIKGAKEAEMFAHSMENRFVGNKVFQEVMPDVYKKSIEYINSLIK